MTVDLLSLIQTLRWELDLVNEAIASIERLAAERLGRDYTRVGSQTDDPEQQAQSGDNEKTSGKPGPPCARRNALQSPLRASTARPAPLKPGHVRLSARIYGCCDRARLASRICNRDLLRPENGAKQWLHPVSALPESGGTVQKRGDFADERLSGKRLLQERGRLA